MRVVLVLEIEELLFDTRAVRASALRDAMAREGVDVTLAAALAAHAGVTAALALERLPAARTLDATGRELVLHRAAALAADAFQMDAPAFDTTVRDSLAALATEVPLAVVTRATLEQAQRWLAAAGLEACVGTVRSLADLEVAEYATAWRETLRRGHAEHGVAIAAPPLLAAAAQAGLRTVHIGETYDRDGAGYHADAQLASLSEVDAGLLAGLFREPRDIPPAP